MLVLMFVFNSCTQENMCCSVVFISGPSASKVLNLQKANQ